MVIIKTHRVFLEFLKHEFEFYAKNKVEQNRLNLNAPKPERKIERSVLLYVKLL